MWPWRRSALFISLVSVVSSILLTMLSGCQATSEETSLRVLLAAHRPFLARLSFADGYLPCATVDSVLCESLRPEERGGHFDSVARLAAATDPHVSAISELIAALAAGQSARVAGVVERLSATCVVAADASCYNDLAVVLWVQGMYGGDLRVKAAALAAVDRALELEPASRAARFNRALLLETTHLDDQALNAWTLLADSEDDAGFSTEAAERRDRLARPTLRERWEGAREQLHELSRPELAALVAAHRQQVRIHLQDVVLPAWGEAVAAGDERAAVIELRLASDLAAELSSSAPGSLHVVESVDRLAEGALDAAAARRLAAGYRLYGEAMVLHESERQDDAEKFFSRAVVQFEEAGDPFIFWPRLYLAVIEHHKPAYAVALSALRELRREVVREDRIAAAYVDWMEGLTDSRMALWEDALVLFRSAARHFAEAGELANLSAMEDQIARTLLQMGDDETGWFHLERALSLRPHLYKSRRLQNPLDTAASSLAQKDDRLALPFLQEWAIEAERAGTAVGIVYNCSKRVESLSRLGRDDEAEAVLQDASDAVARIASRGLRDDAASTDLALAEATFYERRDPRRALSALVRLREFARRSDASLRLIEGLQRESRVHSLLGNAAGAEEALLDAVEEIERQRGLLGDASQRVSYLDRVHSVLETGISFYADSGRFESAFLLAERLRAPVLRERLNPGEPAVSQRSLEELLARLPEGAMIVAYAVLPERLVGWSLFAGELRGWVSTVSEPRITARVESLREALRADRDSKELAADLASYLLPNGLPVEVERLILVPDGPLFGMPFGALPAPDGSARRLYEWMVPELGFSVDTHLDLDAGARGFGDAVPRSVLLVGEVEHDAGRFPELSSATPGSLDPWRRAYPRATVLTGRRATKAAFLAELPEHELIVFVGHSLVPTRRSGRSGLLLASEGEDDGLLTPWEISALPPLRLVREVALIGCATGEGPLSVSEGPRSVARSFVELGVPTVLASLWPIDEQTVRRWDADDPRIGRRLGPSFVNLGLASLWLRPRSWGRERFLVK